MLYGASLWNISKTELEMFEGCIGRSCVQSKASLQDGQKPVCFGWLVQEISRTLILKDKLIFLHSLLQFPDNASPKRFLLACLGSSSPKTWTCTMQE